MGGQFVLSRLPSCIVSLLQAAGHLSSKTVLLCVAASTVAQYSGDLRGQWHLWYE